MSPCQHPAPQALEHFIRRRSHRDLITVGQVLLLPDEPADPPWRLYEVRSGDTLSEIAEARLGDSNRWPEIHDLNRDIVPNPNRIFPGQVLILPR